MNKKHLWSILTVLAVMLLCVGFASCGGDDDDKKDGYGGNSTSTDSGLIGWYKPQDSGNLEGWLKDGDTMDFDSQGNVVVYTPVPWGSGVIDMDLSSLTRETVYYIPDDQTIIKYYGYYYKENSSAAGNKELLYRYFCVGLGYVGVYAGATQYYTYWREDNKLYTTESGWSVFTITSTGLIPDGGSTIYVKYDPSQVY